MDRHFTDLVRTKFQLIEGMMAQEEAAAAVELTCAPLKVVGDEGDQMAVSQVKEWLFKLKSRNTSFRKKIHRALQKIEDGSYGVCEECEQKITQARLVARPTALLCIQCKESEELFECQSDKRKELRIVSDHKMGKLLQFPQLNMEA